MISGKNKENPPRRAVTSASKTLTNEQIEEKAQDFLDQMTLNEKIKQMSGDSSLLIGGIEMLIAYNRRPIPAGQNRRLDIPAIQFSDGPRGVVMNHSTCFPVSMARGATWDTDLEERIGSAIGIEARSQGANFYGGVCINLLRHPAWGRAQETYGEDPYHLGEMGAALVRGVQQHIMACVKHFVCNSIENARFKVDVLIDERTLREVYLPHFRRCIMDEGAAAVMSAYNKVNGEYCGQNSHLLKSILKDEWGFDGFVMSDFIWGIRDGLAAATAGLDVEMPFTIHYGPRLKHYVNQRRITEAAITESVRRILRQKLRFAHVGQQSLYQHTSVASDSHRALAREAAQKSMVLLKNDPLADTGLAALPLDPADVRHIAVFGPQADVENTGDKGSSWVHPPHVITPLQGIRGAGDDHGVRVSYYKHARGSDAARHAQSVDAAIVIVGYSYLDEGEYIKNFVYTRGGDRDQLTLSTDDEELIRAVAGANERTVVVMIGGSAIITEAWRHSVPAILMAWYGGMEGGHALADVLFGAVNPSGRLPCVFPRSADQLPYFDADAETITYDYFHGYRLLQKDNLEPAFPFGFGLSYTSFQYGNVTIDKAKARPDEKIQISVDVSNVGTRAGAEVVQLYIGYEGSSVERSIMDLKGFRRVELAPAETSTIRFVLSAQDLAFFDIAHRKWIVEPITYLASVGPYADSRVLTSATFTITE